MDTIQTMYDWIEILRERPAMYLGNPHRHSFGALIAFLEGLRYGGRFFDGNPPYSFFLHWFCKHVDGMSSNLPCEWMEVTWGNDRAFAAFFEGIDQYRRTEVMRIEIAIPKEKRADDVPDLVFLSQFVPSKVFMLVPVLGDQVGWKFPFHRTVAAAKREAASWWKIKDEDWRPA